MLIKESGKTMYSQAEGVVIKGGTDLEIYNHISNMSEGEFGWVRVVYPCGHVSNIHFRVKKDGPRFTNAHFDAADKAAIFKHLGNRTATTLLADHF